MERKDPFIANLGLDDYFLDSEDDEEDNQQNNNAMATRETKPEKKPAASRSKFWESSSDEEGEGAPSGEKESSAEDSDSSSDEEIFGKLTPKLSRGFGKQEKLTTSKRQPGQDPFAEKKPLEAAAKVDLARKIAAVLKQNGLAVFLSGGGAATMLGGPREINDLDFRIALGPQQSFSTADQGSDALIDTINRALLTISDDVHPLIRADEKTGMTIKGYVNGVEVSITRTPAVEYLAWGEGPSGVPHLGEFDVILDKAYSITMRRDGDFEKRVTDLIDILALIKKQPGLMNVLRGLNVLRGDAYKTQHASATRRNTNAKIEATPLKEFLLHIKAMVDDPDVPAIFEKYKALDLFEFLLELHKYLQEIQDLDDPVIL